MSAVFFDIDGTLHRGDIFKQYVQMLALASWPRTLVVFPLLVVALATYLAIPDRTWSLNFVLSLLTFGRSREDLKQLESKFVAEFQNRLYPFRDVLDRLSAYAKDGREVFLISGSPEHLVKSIYPELLGLGKVEVIGSQLAWTFGCFLIRERCVCDNKVRMLNQRIGRHITLHAGYSDSKKDFPLLRICRHRYRVSRQGAISPWV
jgi:phosphatidylglycerophosphatase C